MILKPTTQHPSLDHSATHQHPSALLSFPNSSERLSTFSLLFSQQAGRSSPRVHWNCSYQGHRWPPRCSIQRSNLSPRLPEASDTAHRLHRAPLRLSSLPPPISVSSPERLSATGYTHSLCAFDQSRGSKWNLRAEDSRVYLSSVDSRLHTHTPSSSLTPPCGQVKGPSGWRHRAQHAAPPHLSPQTHLSPHLSKQQLHWSSDSGPNTWESSQTFSLKAHTLSIQ